MSENNENYNKPNPEVLREKLILATTQIGERVPELIESIKKPDMQTRMIINTFRPFLPRLEDSLQKALNEAPPENILKLVDYVEALHAWLTTD